jgi:hypothetical protein
MVDKKVYKTDYESDFTQFFKKLDIKSSDNPAVEAEVEKYDRVFKLRDTKNVKDSRTKLWEGF